MGKENCKVTVEGKIPRAFAITKKDLIAFAIQFATASSSRVKIPFREVAIILQNDEESAEAHLAINGAEGPTDVITQPYDPLPGEIPGVYGELYVNVDQALRVAPRRDGWSPAKELLLYVAHGFDHLSGADDLTTKGYNQMRRRELNWIKKIVVSLFFAIATTFSLFATDSIATENSFASRDEENFFCDSYAEVAMQFVFPQGDGDMRQLSGAALRLGKNFTPAFASEIEIASLENTCGLAWRNLWHLQGWDWFGKLFGYERFDPFLSGGLRAFLNDGDFGPAIGCGALYYLDDNWALRADADITIGLESRMETIHSVSLSLQYTF